jgi:hypothetical protein
LNTEPAGTWHSPSHASVPSRLTRGPGLRDITRRGRFSSGRTRDYRQ